MWQSWELFTVVTLINTLTFWALVLQPLIRGGKGGWDGGGGGVVLL